MQLIGDHFNGWLPQIWGAVNRRRRARPNVILLLIMLFMIIANPGEVCADAIVDDAEETQHVPFFDDNEAQLELPAVRRDRLKMLPMAVASAAQVVKRILDKASVLAVERIATLVPHHHPAASITSISDAPFRPPRLPTEA